MSGQESYSSSAGAIAPIFGPRITVKAIMNSQPKHILVLEDDANFREIVEFALSNAGFKVTTAAEAVNAVLLAQQEHFDLVVTDYYLPDYPGTDFIRLLREIDGYQHVPVILCSGRASELNKQHLRDDLSILVMSKVCPMKELVDKISGCLATAWCAS